MELLVMEEEEKPFFKSDIKFVKVGCPNVINCRKPGRTGRQTLEVIIKQTLRVIIK